MDEEAYPAGVEDSYLDGKPIVKVAFDQPVVDWAQVIAESVLPYHRTDFSRSGEEEIRNATIGWLGQVAFYYYLERARWEELVKTIPIGRYDDQDYVYKGHHLDVKSSGIAKTPRLLVTETDFLARQDDIYVLAWVRLDLNEVWILGWARKSEVASAAIDRKIRKPAYAIPFKELHEPKEALKLPFKNADTSNHAESGQLTLIHQTKTGDR